MILQSGWCYLSFWALLVLHGDAVELISYISQSGIHGTVEFVSINEKEAQIITSLNSNRDIDEERYSWSINEFPVDFSNINGEERCRNLGKEIIALDSQIGGFKLRSVWHLEHSLVGANGIWGRSIVVKDTNSGKTICSSINFKEPGSTHIAKAKFDKNIQGDVYFFWWADKSLNKTETKVYADLSSIYKKKQFRKTSSHKWKIFTTDILSKAKDESENCNSLQIIFNPSEERDKSKLGDVDERLGKLHTANNYGSSDGRQMFFDPDFLLVPSEIDAGRHLHLVVYDDKHENTVIACARIRSVKQKVLRTNIDSSGFKGSAFFIRQSIFEPTWVNFDVKTVQDASKETSWIYGIRNIPLSPIYSLNSTHCETNYTGGIYDPLENAPYSETGTLDEFAIGNLSGKFSSFISKNNLLELKGFVWDIFLPLDGRHSITHRLLVISLKNVSSCGVLNLYDSRTVQTSLQTAVVSFRYPVVGRIVFRQPKDQPWEDTTILVDYIIHADGASINNTFDHNFGIHEKPIDNDYYSWQNRCASCGRVFTHFQHNLNQNVSDSYRFVGELGNRLGRINIAGGRNNRIISRVLFTDSLIALSGPSSIIGKSIVIKDENGPKARGDRLACSNIYGYHRRKGVVKDWFPNGISNAPMGKMELLQQSEFEITNMEIQLQGVQQNYSYSINPVPVNQVLEFPCEDRSIIEIYDTVNISRREQEPFSKFSSDQYALGDLSGKFGLLYTDSAHDRSFNDTNLPLFGYDSVIGRSVVIRNPLNNVRLACSTIERGYSLQEAREVRAIASFHHPLGYAYGYMRLSQLFGNDGGLSDTTIEVHLKYPGKYNRNATFDHLWQIFVNPVGVDATVKQHETRCVAGGYVWNPYYTQLADPLNEELYKSECHADNPMRCYVGDVSARIGTVDIDGSRRVITDTNFPLAGPTNAQGRSVVLFGPDKSWKKYACANIEPDHDIIKYVNVEKSPKFVLSQFLEDIREAMGVPEWFLEVDSRKTRTLYDDACVQAVLHFRGPYAHKLEQDFSRLLAIGQQDSASIFIPGYVNQKRKSKIHYRVCSADLKELNKRKPGRRDNQKSGQRRVSSRVYLMTFLLHFALINE